MFELVERRKTMSISILHRMDCVYEIFNCKNVTLLVQLLTLLNNIKYKDI